MFLQTLKVTAMNLRSVLSRKGSSSIIVVGIAGVVAVVIGLLSMSEGINSALGENESPGPGSRDAQRHDGRDHRLVVRRRSQCA